jgi:hypothetical protein
MAFGKTAQQVQAEGSPPWLVPHRTPILRAAVFYLEKERKGPSRAWFEAWIFAGVGARPRLKSSKSILLSEW